MLYVCIYLFIWPAALQWHCCIQQIGVISFGFKSCICIIRAWWAFDAQGREVGNWSHCA